MKSTHLVTVLAALGLTIGGGAALAQSQQRPQAHAMRADTDGDQRLSQAEFVAHRMERLTAADANGDGSVSRDEMRAAGQARRATRAAARFDRLDADSNGAISRAEFDARGGRGNGAEAGAHQTRGHRGQARHAGRGESAAPVVIAEARTRAAATFARLDADNDGFITAAERQAARGARGEHRRERMAGHRAGHQRHQPSPSTSTSE